MTGYPAMPIETPMATSAIEQHLGEAMRARQAGREADARRHFEAVLATDPDQPVARNALGMAALESGEPAAAAAHFEGAVRGDPAATPLWMNLAKARRLLGDDEGERAALQGALSTNQAHLMAMVRLAELHERLGETAEAMERWTWVAAVKPSYPNAPPDLENVFKHASDFVAARSKQLGDALDVALADDLARASARDKRRFTAAAQRTLGRRQNYHNLCHGFYYPFLPGDEFFDREHFPWFEELEAATDVIRAELLDILASPDPGLAPYVTMPEGMPDNPWTKLDKSTDWSALHLWKEGKRIDEACARAPKTAAIVEKLPLAGMPNRAPTVFFSILKAGKHIPPHTGVTNTRTIIHLPLIVPGDCEFRVGGETRKWVEGQAFAFDDTIEHEAWNRTDKDRAVLILDCWNPHLSEHERAMICRMFEVADEQKNV